METLLFSAEEKEKIKKNLRNARWLIIASYVFLWYNQLFGYRVATLYNYSWNIPEKISTGVACIQGYILFFIPSVLLLVAGLQLMKCNSLPFLQLGKKLLLSSIIYLLLFLVIRNLVPFIGITGISKYLYLFFSLCFYSLLFSAYENINMEKRQIGKIKLNSLLYCSTFYIALIELIAVLKERTFIYTSLLNFELYILPTVALGVIVLFWSRMLKFDYVKEQEILVLSLGTFKLTQSVIGFVVAYLIFSIFVIIYWL